MKNLFRKLFKKRKERKILENLYNESYVVFEKTGETPKEGHIALIDLYCKTNGKFNDTKNNEIIKKNPKKEVLNVDSALLGSFTDEDFVETNNTLNKDGYAYFTKKLPSHLVDKIVQYALKTPTLMAPNYDEPIVLDSNNLKSEMYRFKADDLMNNTDIQELVMDPFLINIARNYLDSEPIFDFPAMWWSTNYLKEASSEAAQMYHFDLDRLKWLKIFFYLTDVTMETGPHCYIQGSHITGTKPTDLLKRGYARIPDQDLEKYYKKEDFKVICAEAGTIFAGDTKCWHKGTPLKEGLRLVLEFEYTTSLFGATYDKFKVNNYSPEFKEFCNKNTYYSSNFIFDK